MAVFADKGVGEKQELAHDCGQGQLCGFTRSAKPGVEGFEIGVAAAGGDSRHVKRASHMRAAAFDVALAAHLAGIAIDGRDAGKEGDLSAGQDAKLRQTGRQRCGDDRADALDRGEDLVAALQASVFRKDRGDGGFETLDQTGLSVKLGLQQPFKSQALRGAVLVFQRRLTGFGGLPRQNQLLKLRQRLGRNRRRPWANSLSVERQHARVDRIGFCELPERISQLSRPVGIDDGDGEARCAELAMTKPMELSRRLHDDKPGGGGGKLLRQTLTAFLAVGNAKTLANWMQINVEPRFTHIDPGIHCVFGSHGCHLALHAGLAPQSSVQIVSRRADGPSSPASQKLKGLTVPPARLMRDGHPS